MNQISLYSYTAAVVLLETSRSLEWIRMLPIATKTIPHKTLLTSSNQQKRQRKSQSYQILKLTAVSTTRHPQNSYKRPRKHLEIHSNQKMNTEETNRTNHPNATVYRSFIVRT